MAFPSYYPLQFDQGVLWPQVVKPISPLVANYRNELHIELVDISSWYTDLSLCDVALNVKPNINPYYMCICYVHTPGVNLNNLEFTFIVTFDLIMKRYLTQPLNIVWHVANGPITNFMNEFNTTYVENVNLLDIFRINKAVINPDVNVLTTTMLNCMDLEGAPATYYTVI